MLNTKTTLTSKGFDKLISGHPWIHTNDFRSLDGLPQQTGVVHFGEHWFFHSPMSRLRLRRLGPTERLWLNPEDNDIFISDLEKFKSKFYYPLYEIAKSRLEIKKSMIMKNEDICLRWIFSECDLIPGLIVDVFRDTLVCQILTAPIETFWPVFTDILTNAFFDVTDIKPKIIENRSGHVRVKEGLNIIEQKDLKSDWYHWNDLKWWLTPAGPQKTGAYLDQRNNHKLTVNWAMKLDLHHAWDLCSFEGGFGLHLAKEKISVLAVDQSENALMTAHKNAIENNISHDFFKIQKEDVFTFLRNQFEQKNKVDLIVLDPPAFAKAPTEIPSALKGYKELNLRAMHCLRPGGLLVTCTCSQNISRELFYGILQSAAHNARRIIKILETSGPSFDHAPIIGFPQSEYLQAWYLQVF